MVEDFNVLLSVTDSWKKEKMYKDIEVLDYTIYKPDPIYRFSWR